MAVSPNIHYKVSEGIERVLSVISSVGTATNAFDFLGAFCHWINDLEWIENKSLPCGFMGDIIIDNKKEQK